jgi:hypothetical protein
VDCVRSGCIPVYHAHSSVARGILSGAAWIDPADHGHGPRATIEFACAEDITRYQECNEAWLKSPALAETHTYAVFRRIGEIMCRAIRLADNCQCS